MANQTHSNLQATAKGLIAVALSKSPEGNLFRHGHGRLSELPIEEWFGRLRSRSSTAQLSCRSYWKSAAKEMIRQMHSTNKRKGESDRERMEPIGARHFKQASERAFKAACQLAALCGGVNEDSLAMIYAESRTPTSACDVPLHAWEDDDWKTNGDLDEEQGSAENVCAQMLRRVAEEATEAVEDELGDGGPFASVDEATLRMCRGWFGMMIVYDC